MELLIRDFPQLKLVVIGEGPARTPLEQQVASDRLRGHVPFAGAIRDQMELAPWFLTSVAFCSPDNVGLSLLHAMGYRVPCVVSADARRQGPEIEALKSEENGLTYEPGSATDLARQVRKLLESDALRARLSTGALATAQDQYSISGMVDGMERAIRFCAGRRLR